MIDGESQPSNKVLYVNETKVLTCVAEGFPNPTVQWYKGNQPITARSHNFKILVIPTNSSHITKYTCIATNYAGAGKHIRRLNVTVEVKGIYTERKITCIPYSRYDLARGSLANLLSHQ